MTARRIVAAVLASTMLVTGTGLMGPLAAQPVTPAQPGPTDAAGVQDVTPARVSYIYGEVSFWRPGAADWTTATLNTPLAPGDTLYATPGGNVEIQIGPGAFVRATNGTQIALDNQEPDFIQLRMTGGEAAVDLRRLPSGFTVEVDTPNAAFAMERSGYYRIDVDQDVTTFATHRGGTAVAIPAGGGPSPIGADQQVVLTGAESPNIALGAAAQLTAWDNWNYQRTDYLIQPASARYVSAGMYGIESLDRHGSWRTVETYGTVWVPTGMPSGWVPYSTGRWIWDPRFGWTWLDDQPWGWAPYHYGRWVFAGSYWAWAPGPIVVRPVYAPALVVFLGGVTVSVGRPLCWAPLAWGEPLIPWWGRPGFVGVPTWRGWGGPRVVNNVVVQNTTTVNVTNINVYRNVTVNKAVVGVPVDRFGRGEVRPTRIAHTEVANLKPVHGPLEVKPVAASVMPVVHPAPKPPAALRERSVVATRAPHDVTPVLRREGLAAPAAPAPAPRLVQSPRHLAGPQPGGAPEGRRPEPRRETPMVDRPAPPSAPREAPPSTPTPGGEPRRRGRDVERQTPPLPGSPRESSPLPPATPPTVPGQRQGRNIERPTPPAAPGAPAEATPPAPSGPAPEQRRGRTERATPPPVPGAPQTPPAPNAPVEPRRGAERATPPPVPGAPQTPPAPNAPGEPRHGRNVERPATPPAPGQIQPPAPQGNVPDPRRGPAVERPAPPAAQAPAPVPTPRTPAPDRRPIERPAPPAVAPPAPAQPAPSAPAPGSSGSNIERRRAPVAERQAPPQAAPTPAPAPEPRRGAVERHAPPVAQQSPPAAPTPAPAPEPRRGAVERHAPPVAQQPPAAQPRSEPQVTRPAPPAERPARVEPRPGGEARGADRHQAEPRPDHKDQRAER